MKNIVGTLATCWKQNGGHFWKMAAIC